VSKKEIPILPEEIAKKLKGRDVELIEVKIKPEV
jgi:hypothetical protein